MDSDIFKKEKTLFRLISHQLELMVDELEIIDEDNPSSFLNQLIIDLNECSAKIDKLISYNI